MKDTVILVTRRGMGTSPGASELPVKLIGKYFSLLLEGGDLPAAICFYTDGVRLTVAGSPVLDSLQALEARGVRLIICSTCLETFGLADQVRVGIVGGMGDIMEAQFKAGKVISRTSAVEVSIQAVSAASITVSLPHLVRSVWPGPA